MKRKNVRPSDLEKRQYVVHTMIIRMSEKESLQYLGSKGYEMTPRHYYRLKKSVKDFEIEKLVEIAGNNPNGNGLVAQHLERIQQCELVQTELWRLYHESTKSSDKIAALVNIVAIQPTISTYYGATPIIFEEQIREFEDRKKRLDIGIDKNTHTKYDNNPISKFMNINNLNQETIV